LEGEPKFNDLLCFRSSAEKKSGSSALILSEKGGGIREEEGARADKARRRGLEGEECLLGDGFSINILLYRNIRKRKNLRI
jgi:hypothetical protein